MPARDVRKALDDAVRRGWSETSRRVIRVLTLILADSVAGVAGVFTALTTWSLVSGNGLRPRPSSIPLLAMVFCLQPLALRVTGAYRGGRGRTDIGKIAAGVVIAAVFGWLQARLFGSMTPELPNKTAYVYSAFIITAYIWMLRQGVDAIIRAGFKAGVLRRRVLAIGREEDVAKLRELTRCTETSDVSIAGSLSPDLAIDIPNAIESAVSKVNAHGVMIASDLPFEAFEGIINRCFRSGLGVSILPRTLQASGSYFELRESQIGMVLHVFPRRIGVPQLALKRAMDMVLTILAMPIILPVLLLIAIAIKFDSRGPILFRQTRVGVGGKPFEILKFRTMVVGADEQKTQLQHLNQYADPRLFKIKRDPRITRLGRLLRRLSLDELPQLWNVLRGDMSLVGPRPFFGDDLLTYESHHFERLHVLPGITGLWQVSGRSDVVDFEEVVRLDRQYIQEWSVLLDVMILIRTIPAALRRGAY